MGGARFVQHNKSSCALFAFRSFCFVYILVGSLRPCLAAGLAQAETIQQPPWRIKKPAALQTLAMPSTLSTTPVI